MFLPDHPLEPRDGVGDILGHLRECGLANQDFAVSEGHHGGGCPKAMVVSDDLWSSLMPHADITVRASQIYTNSNRHVGRKKGKLLRVPVRRTPRKSCGAEKRRNVGRELGRRRQQQFMEFGL